MMNLISKRLLAGTLAVGVTLGSGASTHVLSHNEAHAATQPYYTYKGYTSSQSKFVLDKNFINALKYDNFKLNGYKITENSKNNAKNKELYDQQFYLASKGKADGVWFNLAKGAVSKKDILKAYGNPNKKPIASPHGMEYQYQIGTKTVKFIIDRGYVNEVGIHNGMS